MFDSIKNWFFKKDIATVFQQNNVQKQQKASILEYKKVGILYQSDGDSNIAAIENFATVLRKANGSTVKTLAYTTENVEKEVGEPGLYYKNQINWYGVPKSTEIDDFTTHKFDILFVLATDFPPHLRYVIAKTQAIFKVGANFRDASDYFDLIIDTKEQTTVAKLIDSITKTINKIATQK